MTAIMDQIRIREAVPVPEWRAARATLDRGLFRKQYKRTKLKDLPSLYPYAELRVAVGALADRWIRDYTARGYTLLTPRDDVLVNGPYKTRDNDVMRNNRVGRLRAVGEAMGEDPYEHLADVVLQAQFLVPYQTTNGRQEME